MHQKLKWRFVHYQWGFGFCAAMIFRWQTRAFCVHAYSDHSKRRYSFFYFLLHMDPWSWSHVSWRPAISIFSFDSSLSAIVVFCTLTSVRSSEIPGHMVLTFHEASLQRGSSCLVVHLLGITLSPRHPLKQTDHGGSMPYWLGIPS